MNPLYLILLLSSLLSSAQAEASYDLRGTLSARAKKYLDPLNTDYGSQYRAQVESELKFNNQFSITNQLRLNAHSIAKDLSRKETISREDKFDFYLGENYLKFQASSWVLQAGLQEISWGEAFGFNYADIVNPRDLRETFYSDYSESKNPLLLVNYKYFFENGSIQLIYSPEPRFSKNLPLSLFTNNLLPQSKINIDKQKTPSLFSENEYGGKIAYSAWGMDSSIYFYEYLDREASYSVSSLSTSSITLKEEHSRLQSTGLSLARTLYDDFVVRSDLVLTSGKKINSLSGTNLLSSERTLTNFLISLDTPTYSNTSAVLIYATSRLDEDKPSSFRKKNQQYSIAKISYDFGEQNILDVSYTHEFPLDGHALQALYNWQYNESIDLKFGAEKYWGEKASQFNQIKNISNLFFGIKKYF